MSQLHHWSSMLRDRLVIEEFFDYLQRHYSEVEVIDINVSKVLDEYHNIDRRKLDDERRALLDESRNIHEKTVSLEI